MNTWHHIAAGRRLTLALGSSALLAACTVGPDYRGPPETAPIASHAGMFHRAGVAPVTDAEPPARWWDALKDPTLTWLVDTGLAHSFTIREAEARLRGARRTIDERRAGLFPSVSANSAAIRAGIPLGDSTALLGGAAGAGQTGASSDMTSMSTPPSHIYTTLYNAGFDATWEIDLFGGTRRGIESARDQAEATQAQLADAQVQLAAEIAQAYVNLRDVKTRLRLLQESVRLEEHQVGLGVLRRGEGTDSQFDVERLRTQLEQNRASLLPLQAQADQYMDQVATLVAVEPGQLESQLSRAGPVPLPPAAAAIGDPAAMLRRRPDIRQAERRLAASNAQIGQAVANFFPKLRLLGLVGFSSTDSSKLFSSDSFTFLGGPTLSWNILDFGRTQAQVSEARASHDEAAARYQSTVMSALQDAETSLSRFGHERAHVLRLTAAEASAARAAAFASQREHAGTSSVIDMLDVERQRIETEQSLAQAQAAMTIDFVSLQKALGLGWTGPDNAAFPVASIGEKRR